MTLGFNPAASTLSPVHPAQALAEVKDAPQPTDTQTHTPSPCPPHRAAHPQAALAEVKDSTLRHTLQFGIGLHHAGLGDGDRGLVERLFVAQKIQVRGAGGRGTRAAGAGGGKGA